MSDSARVPVAVFGGVALDLGWITDRGCGFVDDLHTDGDFDDETNT